MLSIIFLLSITDDPRKTTEVLFEILRVALFVDSVLIILMPLFLNKPDIQLGTKVWIELLLLILWAQIVMALIHVLITALIK